MRREDLRIRKAVMEDIEQVFHIEAQSFFTPYSKRILQECIESPRHLFYVLYRRDLDEILGYYIADMVLDELNLNNIAVKEVYRGMGLSKLLLKDCLDRGKECGMRIFELEVRTKNEAAIALYESFGFEKVGMRRGYYTDTHEDAYLMNYYLE